MKFLLSLSLVFNLTTNAYSNALASTDVVDLSLIDQSKNPCDDFFAYACGNWLKNNPIPADKGGLYRFDEIDENTLIILKKILQSYEKGVNVPAQADSKKLGDYYSACLNTESNEHFAKEKISNLFHEIDSLKKKKDLMPLLAKMHRQGISAFFSLYVMQNPGDATHMIGALDQGGMGLPEKSYYADKEFLKIRKQYKMFIQRSFELAGASEIDAAEAVRQIFQIESKISKISLSAQEQQDPIKTYNPIGKMALAKLSPAMNWKSYFKAIHFPESDAMDVVSPSYFQKLSFLVDHLSLEEIKYYLKWRAMADTASISILAIRNESFKFYGKTLNGKSQPEAQWKTCIHAVDSSMGEALGQSFIQMAFGQESKNLADSMVSNVRASLKELITKLDWMDDATKGGALKKINALNQKIGYPKSFKSYEKLQISRDAWIDNEIAARTLNFDEMIARANLPVDRNLWGMTPPTNNAYYDPTMNEIVFPAGILQAPLFNVQSSVAANFGATGATMGHEMTHGFDVSGSQYDEFGNLKNWWSENSAKIFKEKSQCIIDQFSKYTTDDGTPLDGQLSVTENIADLGGLKIALQAYYKLNPSAESENLKTFFLAYAQSWCGHLTKEAERTQIQTDTHSIPKFRVNGVLSNIPDFANVYQCAEGAKMAPKNRCSVW
ncbi:MAG: M13 family metallopeptidase [Bacteriovorax sp.]